jgi:hypothetical protein
MLAVSRSDALANRAWQEDAAEDGVAIEHAPCQGPDRGNNFRHEVVPQLCGVET